MMKMVDLVQLDTVRVTQSVTVPWNCIGQQEAQPEKRDRNVAEIAINLIHICNNHNQ